MGDINNITAQGNYSENADYAGATSQADLAELNKALGTGEVGDAYGGGAYNEMTAIRPQSLESTLKVVTASLKQVKMWRLIGKKSAFNTVEEFNVLDSYGGDSSPFFVEGGLPSEEDSNYLRQSAMVKFMGTTRVVTHPAMVVKNTVGDMLVTEQKNGTTWLIQQLERALYFADSALDPLAFDGIESLIKKNASGKSWESQHVIDMRGNPITEDILEDCATIIADNYGSGELVMHMTNQVHKDFSKLAHDRQRISYGTGDGITLGQPVRGYKANSADIDFLNNTFIKPEGSPRVTGSKGAPSAPTFTAGTALATVADATSLMSSNTYHYWVGARNADGNSVGTYIGSIAIPNGARVDITINRSTSDPVATSYKVYRGSTSDVTKAMFAFEVKDAGVNTTQVLSDKNFDIPGTHKAFLLDMDSEQSFCFKQLAPLTKLPLARISACERFMILLYGMVQMYNPRRNILFKNIGLLGNNSNRPLFGKVSDQVSYGTVRPTLQFP